MKKSNLVVYILIVLSIIGILFVTFYIGNFYNIRKLKDFLGATNEILAAKFIILKEEANTAFANVSSSNGCDAELFSELVLDNHFIKDVGIIQNDTIICNAIAGSKTKINLGTPTILNETNPNEKIWVKGNKYYWKKNNYYIMIDVLFLFKYLKGVDIVYIYYKPNNTIFYPWYTDEIQDNKKQAILALFTNLLNNQPSSSLDKYVYANNNTELPQLGIISVKRYQWQEWIKENVILYTFLGFIEGLLVSFLVLKIRQKFTSMPYLLKKAIANNQLYVVYQPLIDLTTFEIVGCEALVRWKMKNGENIGPNVFIPIVEKEGLSYDLTMLVFRKIVEEVGKYLKNSNFYVSINFSAIDLYDEKLATSFLEGIKKAGLTLKNMPIELSERHISDPSNQKGLQLLIEAGALLSIDDFGTGVSNLSYLGKLSPHYIKVDKQFVDWSDGEGPTAELLGQLIQIGKNFGIKIVVEGVETKAQLERIKLHQADVGQGYLWHRPMPIHELFIFLRKRI